jgi:exosortase K
MVFKSKKWIPENRFFNLPLFYIASICVFILLKIFYSFANTDSLLFILKPTAKLVGLVTGADSAYIPNNGFFFDSLNIIIDSSCSGFNFLMICFVMLCFIILRYSAKTRFRFYAVPISLILAYVLAIFVNASRIIFYIVFDGYRNIISKENARLIHQFEGTFMYLSFLILIYICADLIFIKMKARSNERHK